MNQSSAEQRVNPTGKKPRGIWFIGLMVNMDFKSIFQKMSDLPIAFFSPVHNNRSVTYGCMPLNIHDKYAQMAHGFLTAEFTPN
jgi:hypothetical protein